MGSYPTSDTNFYRSTSLIHHYDVEGVLGPGEREHIPLQWPRVSLLTWGTLQMRIRFVRQRSNPTLEQTNNVVIEQSKFLLRIQIHTTYQFAYHGLTMILEEVFLMGTKLLLLGGEEHRIPPLIMKVMLSFQPNFRRCP